MIIMALLLTSTNVYSIEDSTPSQPIPKNSKFSFLKQKNNVVKLNNKSKVKKASVTEVELPPVRLFDAHLKNYSVMAIDDCVNYAIAHHPALGVSEEMVNIAKSGIGQQRSNYFPRLTASVGYNHRDVRTKMGTTDSDSTSFNAGISELIWDFGRTTARIDMAKYDTMSAEYDHEYELLNVIYNVKVNYYKVLMALANLDIFEQNARINTLNYERTKAMFDEGLRSKIDVVNAEVNLADAKIQIVDGRNTLANAIIDLENSMYYSEQNGFVVKNTENFGFLKADYKKKMQNIDKDIKPSGFSTKKNDDGVITLSSGIEHNDIIKDYVLNSFKMSKQEVVDKALSERPDLKSNRMLVKVQEKSLSAIRRQYAPEIVGDLSWNYTKNEHSYTSPLQLGASVGLGALNPYLIHYQVLQGESYLNIAKQNVNIAKVDIYWEVQQNYVKMRQLEKKIPLMQQKVKATLENFELADGRYSVGLNNYVELQDALVSYNNAQLNFVESVFEYNVARETLFKSMGIR